MSDPFRDELAAAHARIAKLETDHAARIAELEGENARLRKRLVDGAPSARRSGRTFGALAMIIFGVSVLGGIVFARVAARTPPHHARSVASIDDDEIGDDTVSSTFDRDSVIAALSAVRLDGCAQPDGPHGAGHVKVTFDPSGRVIAAIVDEPPYRGTPVGACVELRFRTAHVPAFTGPARFVGKAFTL